ncbi:MAG: hypothetical protein WA874_14840 [Chryseosolibacter sp.]
MFIPFESLAPASRIWIFQANRPFVTGELKVAETRLRAFTEDWAAHGIPLKTSYKIEFNQFIILAADETHHAASGCSIDSSVRILKELETALDIQLFDRTQAAFKTGDHIILVPLSELKQKFQNGTLKADSLTFNNVLTTKSEFDESWIVPVSKTWLKRYIPNELANVE